MLKIYKCNDCEAKVMLGNFSCNFFCAMQFKTLQIKQVLQKNNNRKNRFPKTSYKIVNQDNLPAVNKVQMYLEF